MPPPLRFGQDRTNQMDKTELLTLKRRQRRQAVASDDGIAAMMAGLATKADLQALATAESAMSDALSTSLAAETAARVYADMQEGQARASADDGKEPAVVIGTTAQYWRGDKTWRAIAVGEISGLSASLTGLSDAYKAADTALDTKINARLKRVGLGNVVVTWGLQLLATGFQAPVDKAVSGLLLTDTLVELRPAAAMPTGYAMAQAYIKANGTLSMVFSTPALTLVSPAVTITFEVIVLRSGA